MLLVKEKHNLYVIDQRNKIIAEGSWVSLVSPGQGCAGIWVTLGVLWVSGGLYSAGNVCQRNMKNYWSFWDCIWIPWSCISGHWGAKDNILSSWEKETLPNFAIAGECLHPGRRTAQTECLPSEACPCSKAHSELFTYGSMQEFIIWPSVLFVCIHNLHFITEILAAALPLPCLGVMQSQEWP